MKKLLFSLLFALPVMAQDGFRNENGKLIWQHTYPAATNMQAQLDGNPELQINTFVNDVHTGSADKIKNTCQEGSPVMRNDCKFDFEVRKDNGNYVVTVTNLKIIEVMGPMQARTVVNRCEKYFVDATLKVKKDPRTQKDMGCADSFLTEVFGGGSINGSQLTMTAN
ncbi:hypothetical protein R1T16_05745 [Flavobacterium sp. DG1-102-2]|uniref:hypothetical protein n=1 Tax=Flavobacterium sp. DG1-102-2 TaxID=3081663 RepID=UPI00294A646A|nr:hypothetical protein [Flavobacterium sp. DG1-102-2]MDV6167918.1 hypothetical protein [Flavobacterium sp. DG1-102-2]